MRCNNHNRRSRFRWPAPLCGAAAVLGLLLSGCMVGPDFKAPEAPVNPEWNARSDPRVATQTAADTQWWKAFNDSALDRLVDLAYEQNLSLQMAGLRIVEARARLGITSGKQFPQLQVLGASASADGLTKNLANAANVDRNFFSYQVGFDAVWELDFWGKFRRGVESDAAGLLATVADYYYALVSLNAEVARTYTVFRTYEVLVEQARANVVLQEEGLRIAESRFRNGATSELDVTQATALLESTRASIPQLDISAQQARNALSTLLGQPSGNVDALLDGPKAIPKAPEKVAISVPAEMLRRRPDIRGAELSAAAQCARIGVAKAELYPSFSLFGSIGLAATSSGLGSHSLLSSDSLVYTAGPRISWPFFNYGRLKNNVRVEDARFQQLLVGYRETVIKAAQEVEDALVGYINSQQSMLFEQGSVDAARRAQEIAVVQYREGAVDYQRVLDAQRSQLEEENRLAQASSSVATNVIALYKALGGGWEFRQGQAYVSEANRKEMEERTGWGDLLTAPRSTEVEHAAAVSPTGAPAANPSNAPPVSPTGAPPANPTNTPPVSPTSAPDGNSTNPPPAKR
jgi:NodT family efflux transporter outer membrane factor (OMF) lipoprotein